jgi:hypothetical protein
MKSALCEPSDLRLLANIAFLASRMRWQEESDKIFDALADSVETKADLLFAWLSARCSTGDMSGAGAVLSRMEALPPDAAEIVMMARCYFLCCCHSPEWVEIARRVTRAGPQAFGYAAADAMLAEHESGQRIR